MSSLKTNNLSVSSSDDDTDESEVVSITKRQRTSSNSDTIVAQTPVSTAKKVSSSLSSSVSITASVSGSETDLKKKAELSRSAEMQNDIVNAYIALNGEVKAAQHFSKEETFNKMLFMFLLLKQWLSSHLNMIVVYLQMRK